MSFVFSVIHFCDFKIVPCGWLPFAQLAYITVYAANTNNISYQHIQVVQLAIYSLPQTIMLPACVVATKTLWALTWSWARTLIPCTWILIAGVMDGLWRTDLVTFPMPHCIPLHRLVNRVKLGMTYTFVNANSTINCTLFVTSMLSNCNIIVWLNGTLLGSNVHPGTNPGTLQVYVEMRVSLQLPYGSHIFTFRPNALATPILAMLTDSGNKNVLFSSDGTWIDYNSGAYGYNPNPADNINVCPQGTIRVGSKCQCCLPGICTAYTNHLTCTLI